ncbi:MAG TPA: AraC family transcriptional regulator [Phototrophicaceae bacterium]|nr:AraC family transcriptional regulator [Phototrophicaceae bacterium]
MTGENARLWSVQNLRLMRATYITYAFSRHVHDYFAIGVIEAGVQQFSYRHEHYFTPPTGLFLLNPDEPHDGQAATADGFTYRVIYPEAELMQQVAAEVAGRSRDVPFFSDAVVDDPTLYHAFLRLHRSLEDEGSALEQQSRILILLASLITRHADAFGSRRRVGSERREVERVRAYLDAHYADDVTLDQLGQVANLSPYYLVRVFHHEVGLPPHAYLASVRVRRAQDLLAAGQPIADVAYATGFSSQSHLTNTFRRYIGVTPSQYAHQRKILQDL